MLSFHNSESIAKPAESVSYIKGKQVEYESWIRFISQKETDGILQLDLFHTSQGNSWNITAAFVSHTRGEQMEYCPIKGVSVRHGHKYGSLVA